MLFPPGAMQRTNVEKVCQDKYDVVIVGSGITGAIIAKELAEAGKRVLVLEAGVGGDGTLASYEELLNRYYATPRRTTSRLTRSTRTRRCPGAPTRADHPGLPNKSGLPGPDRPVRHRHDLHPGPRRHDDALGGQGPPDASRRLPDGGNVRQGEDWPFDHVELEPYYEKAEREIGVSADVKDQDLPGPWFPTGYVYPMQACRSPTSTRRWPRGSTARRSRSTGDLQLKVRPLPPGPQRRAEPSLQGRQGLPTGRAVSTTQVEFGGRCQGNNDCVPICPVQAKYNAGKTLAKALRPAGSTSCRRRSPRRSASIPRPTASSASRSSATRI